MLCSPLSVGCLPRCMLKLCPWHAQHGMPSMACRPILCPCAAPYRRGLCLWQRAGGARELQPGGAGHRAGLPAAHRMGDVRRQEGGGGHGGGCQEGTGTGGGRWDLDGAAPHSRALLGANASRKPCACVGTAAVLAPVSADEALPAPRLPQIPHSTPASAAAAVESAGLPPRIFPAAVAAAAEAVDIARAKVGEGRVLVSVCDWLRLYSA